jgi:hypothetical protein
MPFRTVTFQVGSFYYDCESAVQVRFSTKLKTNAVEAVCDRLLHHTAACESMFEAPCEETQSSVFAFTLLFLPFSNSLFMHARKMTSRVYIKAYKLMQQTRTRKFAIHLSGTESITVMCIASLTAIIKLVNCFICHRTMQEEYSIKKQFITSRGAGPIQLHGPLRGATIEPHLCDALKTYKHSTCEWHYPETVGARSRRPEGGQLRTQTPVWMAIGVKKMKFAAEPD